MVREGSFQTSTPLYSVYSKILTQTKTYQVGLQIKRRALLETPVGREFP